MQYNGDMQNIYQAKGSTIVEQYRDVGKLFATSIYEAVNKLSKKRSMEVKRRRVVAEKAWRNLQNKSECLEFVQCLTAWSEGAGISVSQAMWLLADNLSGCQTLMGRYGSGVILLHTEEEFIDPKHIEFHLNSPHTVEFRERDEVSKTLTYDNLLPGCGLFSWKKNMLVAVDSLFLREDGIEEVEMPLLINVVSWLIWRMKPSEANPEKIVVLTQTLGELIDGYAINVVRKMEGAIEGYKLTLARSEYHVENLGSELGSYMRQVNIVDQDYPAMDWALPLRKIWRGGAKYNVARLKNLVVHANRYMGWSKFILDKQKVVETHNQIQQTIFTDLREAYINPDMRALCVGMVDVRGTSVSCKLNDEQPISQLEYLDVQN